MVNFPLPSLMILLYSQSNLIMSATYGGHMELSAFAHLSKRNIKVIQPGLVYLIEWQAGESSSASTSNSTSQSQPSQDEDPLPERRRSKRTRRPPPSSSSKQPSNSNHDKNQQIVKIGTGEHGYYVYEEISDTEDDNDIEDDIEVEESLTPDDKDDQGEESGGGQFVYVAYVFFNVLS